MLALVGSTAARQVDSHMPTQMANSQYGDEGGNEHETFERVHLIAVGVDDAPDTRSRAMGIWCGSVASGPVWNFARIWCVLTLLRDGGQVGGEHQWSTRKF